MADSTPDLEPEPTARPAPEAWTLAGLVRLRRQLACVQAESQLLSAEAQSALKEIATVLRDALSLDFLEQRVTTVSADWPDGALRVLWSGGEAKSIEPLMQGLSGLRGWPRLTLVPDLTSALGHLKRAPHDLLVITLGSETDLESATRELASLQSPPVVVVLSRPRGAEPAMARALGVDVVEERDLTAERLRSLVARALARRRLLLDLSETQKRLEELVHRDPLTGLYNRRYFESRLAIEFARASRFGETLSLVLFDVDHFKSINDTHGHPVGDAVLVSAAELILGGIRSIDLLARVGGEEFALLLPNTGSDGARGLVERVVERVRTHAFGTSAHSIRVTLSAGIATCPCEGCLRPGRLYENADTALYAAKRLGRDRVEVFSESTE